MFFDWLKRKVNKKHKNFLNSGIGVARVFDWLGNPRITCNMTPSEIFKSRDFLWDKNTVEWKIRSLGPWLVLQQDVAQVRGLEPKVNVFEICVKLWGRGEETNATQAHHRLWSWGEAHSP